MNVGKTRRLKRIMQKDHRTVIVPMDHGVTIGPIHGITNMQIITNQLTAGNVDAILVHKGIAKTIDVDRAGLIVMLSGMSNLSPNVDEKVQVCSVQEAVRIGADAVSVHVNVGAQYEDKMLKHLGRVSEECDIFGIPLLAMMYPRGPKIQSEHDATVVAHAARIGAELGADIIKTNYTGDIDTFKGVIESCPVPIVIAGGPKCKSPQEVLQTTSDALVAGAAGLSIGRNVFQFENPTRITKALSAIVHENASVEKAIKIIGEKS
ncbi:MAG: 2-amino-3,7-dideoxy-D-threo-hept-6-ulosonate synthase [Candidatus Bathyarchaeota archaeon]|nr:2-amino-3,7-dideoxy-D-threo-hept-6-ulosonate synthase [Candidatus Bathyarchaeota archaeon]MDI9577468.1 2-amino-3,7-dideoxy-D-threo-hept-6-ulosonate synthase [Thermoproteota archaeon]